MGYHVFPSKALVSHSTENFPRATLVFQKSSGVEIFLDNRSLTILSIFLSDTAEKVRRGALLCFTKWYPKILRKRGGERVSHFSVKNFWSKCQTLSYGNPLVRHYFRVSKNFMLKRVMSRFNVDIFCLTVSRKVCCNTSVSKNFGHRKNFLRRGDHDFLSTIFCLTVPKKNCRNNSVYRKNSGIEKTFRKGGSLFSVENFLSHTTETIRKGTLLCLRKLLVQKKFHR